MCSVAGGRSMSRGGDCVGMVCQRNKEASGRSEHPRSPTERTRGGAVMCAAAY
ncbi:hypothetical protein Hanom_Chr07g00619341 [Helianthus anomalus]